ncbi:MAG: thioredoxin family protein [Nitrospira sp.]
MTGGEPLGDLYLVLDVVLLAADFDLHATRSDFSLVVDFWEPWCGPCRMITPAYEQAAKMLDPHVRLAKVNTEAESLGARFGIQSIPTMIVLRGGREVARQSRALGPQDIVRWVRAHL